MKPHLLDNYAIFLAKMEVRRGLEVTIDTINLTITKRPSTAI